MATYDPLTGLLKRSGGMTPDTDPTGRYGLGLFGAAPTGGGISPTSAGGGGYAGLLTIPGTRPDFMGLLNSDPLLQQFRSNSGAEGIADRAGLTAARQRALAQFGLVPDFSNSLGIAGSDIGEDVTPETRALAAKNTSEGLSTVGRLNHEFERVQQNIMDALAARGALRSGASGVALNDLQHDRKIAMTDAEQQLLDYLGGVQQAYVQSQRQRAGELSAQQQAAAGRFDPSALYGTPSQEAVHVGNGVYRSPDGRLWNADGTPYNGAAAPAPAPAPATQPTSYDTAATRASSLGAKAAKAVQTVSPAVRYF